MEQTEIPEEEQTSGRAGPGRAFRRLADYPVGDGTRRI